MTDELLDRLRDVARECAEAGYYGDYIKAVVAEAVRGKTPANPDEDRAETAAE